MVWAVLSSNRDGVSLQIILLASWKSHSVLDVNLEDWLKIAACCLAKTRLFILRTSGRNHELEASHLVMQVTVMYIPIAQTGR